MPMPSPSPSPSPSPTARPRPRPQGTRRRITAIQTGGHAYPEPISTKLTMVQRAELDVIAARADWSPGRAAREAIVLGMPLLREALEAEAEADAASPDSHGHEREA